MAAFAAREQVMRVQIMLRFLAKLLRLLLNLGFLTLIFFGLCFVGVARRFAEGLEQTVDWYRDNAWWWEPIRSAEYREYYERQYGHQLR